MKNFTKLPALIVIAALLLGGTGIAYAATNAIETQVGLFETSLAASISSSATSMTLSSGLTKNGTALASSTYSFIVDEGTASEEFVIADCTSTACTNMQRGLSVVTGTTTVASLQKAHRRGASVKMTDGPLLVKLARIFNGIGSLPVKIWYTTHPTFTSDTELVDKKYVDDTAFSGAGVIDATTAARGVVELATQAEAAASTASGSSGPLALPASIATSTYNSATAANRVVVTLGTGKIDNYFISTTTLFTTALTAGTTTINGTGILTGYASSTTYSTAGSFTWAKASTIGTYLRVQCWGGGGSGGAKTAAGTQDAAGGGGGAYKEDFYPIRSLGTTETITIGAGGTAVSGSSNGNSGGNTSFGSWLVAYGGEGGDQGGTVTGANGGGGNAIGGIGSGRGTVAGTAVSEAVYWGGGGSGGISATQGGLAGGNAWWGGAGGGGTSNGSAAGGGTSVMGGNGGAANLASSNATSGSAPGGGGGGHVDNAGSSGAGGDGRCILTAF